MKEERTEKKGAVSGIYGIQRAVTILVIAMAFFPIANPAKICDLVSSKISLFTSAVSYTALTGDLARAFRMSWISETFFIIAYIGAVAAVLGIIATGAGACMSLGNTRLQRLGLKFSILGAVAEIAGYVVCFVSYIMLNSEVGGDARLVKRVGPEMPVGVFIYGALALIVLVLSLAIMGKLPKVTADMRYEMDSKYKLFLMFLPFAFMAFLFCYLPLYGWRYAFFDYKPGGTLSMKNFVGFKWFAYLFQNEATRTDLISVIRNTLGISALNIATQWLPMIFAVFLCEVRNMKFRRFVQAFTTIPNFISWVLVYAVALSIFSTDGFINTFAKEVGLLAADAKGKNYLMGDSHTWIKMWAWGTWKGVGWSAIIYIAGISGIDQSLYEAATVDGAGRFQKIWHITLPGLLPTFFVLLLMAISGMLNNGLDQYLVFYNAENREHIRVLDLYVYQIGIEDGSLPLSTVVGMFKSVISVILLFSANALSKALRGESIV